MMQKIKLTGWLGQETLVSVTQGSVIESTSALVVWRDSKGKSLFWAVRLCCASANLSTSQENNLSSTLFLFPSALVFSWQRRSLAQAWWWTIGHWEARQVCEVGGAGQVQRGDWIRPRKTSSNKPSSSTSGSRKASSNTPSFERQVARSSCGGRYPARHRWANNIS